MLKYERTKVHEKQRNIRIVEQAISEEVKVIAIRLDKPYLAMDDNTYMQSTSMVSVRHNIVESFYN